MPIDGHRLSRMSEAELLRTRVCDLDLRIEGPLARCVENLYEELRQRGLSHFQPSVYLGDDWFSPDGVPAISVPFWLTHPRLRRIEKRHMRQVEGGTQEWCMRLLRHEAGHSFDHAYGVATSREFRQIFGDPTVRYDVDRYDFDPRSRDFVINLEDHYAQSHPEEDFAETFAVVLDPRRPWRNVYRAWPGALRKLQYVEGLIERLGPRSPRVTDGPQCYKASRMRRTLGRYYETRRLRA